MRPLRDTRARLRLWLRRKVRGERHIVKAMVLVVRPRDDALLVSENADPSGAVFHRPLGGHVEFGEPALETARRELEEEIGQALCDVTLVRVLENIFRWGNEPHHEVIFVFSARFADEAAYDIEDQLIRDAREPTPVIWRRPDTESPPLYPEGVRELVTSLRGSSPT